MIYGGIDAGGTSTKCILVDDTGQELARVKTGPANYQVVGLEKAVGEIRRAVKLACQQAGLTEVDVLGIGMAGAGRREDIDRIREKLIPIEQVKRTYLTDDGEIGVLGAHGGKCGIVLIAGTGSIVYGIKEDGATIRGGGWGPFLGDEGSGFWIGLESLKAAIKSVENRGEKTRLVEIVKDKLGLDDLRELIPFIYQKELPRTEIASLAPEVINLMSRDQVADGIIRKGIDELIRTIEGVKAQLNIAIEEVAVSGGLFESQSFYQLFTKELKNKTGLILTRPSYSAVYGAVFYGARQIDSSFVLMEGENSG